MGRPFKIDGIDIPTPTIFKVGIEDLSSEATGRTLDGMMHKDVVAVKDTFECTWKDLSWAESAHLINLLDGKESFLFTYPDPRLANRWLTGTFYAGQRSLSARNLAQGYWSDITVSIIQI